MRTSRRFTAAALVVAGAMIGCEQPKETPATQQSPSKDVAQRTTESRAVEAVIWRTPAVNFDSM